MIFIWNIGSKDTSPDLPAGEMNKRLQNSVFGNPNMVIGRIVIRATILKKA